MNEEETQILVLKLVNGDNILGIFNDMSEKTIGMTGTFLLNQDGSLSIYQPYNFDTVDFERSNVLSWSMASRKLENLYFEGIHTILKPTFQKILNLSTNHNDQLPDFKLSRN